MGAAMTSLSALLCADVNKNHAIFASAPVENASGVPGATRDEVRARRNRRPRGRSKDRPGKRADRHARFVASASAARNSRAPIAAAGRANRSAGPVAIRPAIGRVATVVGPCCDLSDPAAKER
jgi:hypothetical protein